MQKYPKNEFEYIDFKIINQGIMPLPNKVEAINNIADSTTKK